MRNTQALVVDTLEARVGELYQKFGVWKTARALFLAVWRHRQTKNQISHLSNRMRRDIGLPEGEEAPQFSLWDIRPW
jgi:hypothetical protein